MLTDFHNFLQIYTTGNLQQGDVLQLPNLWELLGDIAYVLNNLFLLELRSYIRVLTDTIIKVRRVSA